MGRRGVLRVGACVGTVVLGAVFASWGRPAPVPVGEGADSIGESAIMRIAPPKWSGTETYTVVLRTPGGSKHTVEFDVDQLKGTVDHGVEATSAEDKAERVSDALNEKATSLDPTNPKVSSVAHAEIVVVAPASGWIVESIKTKGLTKQPDRFELGAGSSKVMHGFLDLSGGLSLFSVHDEEDTDQPRSSLDINAGGVRESIDLTEYARDGANLEILALDVVEQFEMAGVRAVAHPIEEGDGGWRVSIELPVRKAYLRVDDDNAELRVAFGVAALPLPID